MMVNFKLLWKIIPSSPNMESNLQIMYDLFRFSLRTPVGHSTTDLKETRRSLGHIQSCN